MPGDAPTMERRPSSERRRSSVTRPATIRDVAARAGTSTATVSRVLNKSGYVSEDLREKVLQAARELGYSPNAVARSLKRSRTRTVGVIIGDIANPFFASVVRGIQDVLEIRGYHPLICNTDLDVKKEAMYVRLLYEKRVDGMIISTASGKGDHLRLLEQHQLPRVFINRRPSGLGGPAVLTDNRAGAYEATMHLIDCGHRRIGIVAGSQDVNTGKERLQGFLEAMADRGLHVPEERISYGNFTVEGGYRATLELMNPRETDRPTALFICNNQMTVGALRALRELGMAIPQDVGLIAFDETEWARLMEPPLSTVEQLTYEMGQAAARILLRSIERQEVSTYSKRGQDVYLKPRLIIRGSCGQRIADDDPVGSTAAV